MIRRPALCLACAVCLSALSSPAAAATIDDFVDGLLSESGAPLSVAATQTGLDPATVIGGARYVEADHSGELSIDGGLVLDHDGPTARIASTQYGSFRASFDPLNADLTDGGASDRLLVRVAESQPSSPLGLGISLLFRSGATGPTPGAGGFAIDLIDSAAPYTLSIPLAAMTGNVDYTDIDGVSVSYFLQTGGRIEIDSIESASLPAGDLNADGVVDLADYDTYVQFYGVEAPLSADANGNGVVDAADYTIWRDNLPAALAAIAVPEPAALALVAFAFAPLCRRRSA